jgi:hypothetical protein
MDKSSNQSPIEPIGSRAKDTRWHPLTWGVIGFAIGTVVTSLFVLSRDPIVCAEGGAIFGGLPAALYAFMMAVEKRRERNPHEK